MISTAAFSLLIIALSYGVGAYADASHSHLDRFGVGVMTLMIAGLIGGVIIGLSYELSKALGWA